MDEKTSAHRPNEMLAVYCREEGRTGVGKSRGHRATMGALSRGISLKSLSFRSLGLDCTEGLLGFYPRIKKQNPHITVSEPQK